MARNDRKRNEKDPDFSGSIELGDPPVHWWLASWINEGKPGSKMEGKRYFSLKFTPKDAPRAAVAPRDDDMAPTPVPAAPPPKPPVAPGLNLKADDPGEEIPF